MDAIDLVSNKNEFPGVTEFNNRANSQFRGFSKKCLVMGEFRCRGHIRDYGKIRSFRAIISVQVEKVISALIRNTQGLSK